MNGLPQEKKTQEINEYIAFFNELKPEDFNSFKAKRTYKWAKKLYEKYPEEWRTSSLYCASMFINDKKNESIKLYKDLVLPKSNRNLVVDYLAIFTNYAEILYSNKNYDEALNIIRELDNFEYKFKNYIFFRVLTSIYFEKDLYDNILENLNILLKKNNYIDIRDLIYSSFIFYHFLDKDNLVVTLNKISEIINKRELCSENINFIFEVIEKSLTSVLKPELTDKEKDYLNKIKEFTELLLEYENKERKIYFDNKEFLLNTSVFPNNWIYGEIKEFEKGAKSCRSQANKIDDLENSIKQYLELIIELDDDSFVPTKEFLEAMRKKQDSSVDNLDKDTNTNLWLKDKLDSNFSNFDKNEEIPLGKPVKYVSGVGLVYIDE